MEVFRRVLVFVGIIFGTILIASGAYYLITQRPLLIHSYTLLSILFVAVGLLLLASSVLGIHDLKEFNEGTRQVALVVFSVFILGLGSGLYIKETSRVKEHEPKFSTKSLFVVDVSTDIGPLLA